MRSKKACLLQKELRPKKERHVAMPFPIFQKIQEFLDLLSTWGRLYTTDLYNHFSMLQHDVLANEKREGENFSCVWQVHEECICAQTIQQNYHKDSPVKKEQTPIKVQA